MMEEGERSDDEEGEDQEEGEAGERRTTTTKKKKKPAPNAAAGRGAPWANEALDLIEQLLRTNSTNRDAREQILKQLRKLSDRTSRGATPSDTSEARAQYTLHRWVDIWESTAAWESRFVSVSRGSAAGSGDGSTHRRHRCAGFSS